MKQIELKRVTMDDGSILDYRSILEEVAKRHPQGITVDEMEKAVRVLAALKRAVDAVKLEDADWEILKQYLAVYRFGIVDVALIQFRDDVRNAPTIEP